MLIAEDVPKTTMLKSKPRLRFDGASERGLKLRLKKSKEFGPEGVQPGKFRCVRPPGERVGCELQPMHKAQK
jgi:hypothetical protein